MLLPTNRLLANAEQNFEPAISSYSWIHPAAAGVCWRSKGCGAVLSTPITKCFQFARCGFPDSRYCQIEAVAQVLTRNVRLAVLRQRGGGLSFEPSILTLTRVSTNRLRTLITNTAASTERTLVLSER